MKHPRRDRRQDMKRNALVFATLCLLGSLLTPASALGQGSGYALADRPTAPSRYLASSAYSYSSSSRPIVILRRRPGIYQVMFIGLGGNGRPGGNVQVTAYGDGPEHCKVADWDSSGADFIVDVRCFGRDQQFSDAQYSVIVTWPAAQTGGRPTAGAADSAIKDRRWKDGHFEVELEDGTILLQCRFSQQVFDGNEWICPLLTALDVRYANLPRLPANPRGGVNAWIVDQADFLLTSIENHVMEGELDGLLESEIGMSTYEKIDWRTRFLDFMLAAYTQGDAN